MLIYVVGAPLLLVPKVRVVMFIVYCVFHYLNHVFWNIGIFSWLKMTGTLIFFASNWKRPVAAKISKNPVATTPRFAHVQSYQGFIYSVVFWLTSQALIPLRPWFFDGDPHWTEHGH